MIKEVKGLLYVKGKYICAAIDPAKTDVSLYKKVSLISRKKYQSIVDEEPAVHEPSEEERELIEKALECFDKIIVNDYTQDSYLVRIKDATLLLDKAKDQYEHISEYRYKKFFNKCRVATVDTLDNADLIEKILAAVEDLLLCKESEEATMKDKAPDIAKQQIAMPQARRSRRGNKEERSLAPVMVTINVREEVTGRLLTTRKELIGGDSRKDVTIEMKVKQDKKARTIFGWEWPW